MGNQVIQIENTQLVSPTIKPVLVTKAQNPDVAKSVTYGSPYVLIFVNTTKTNEVTDLRSHNFVLPRRYPAENTSSCDETNQ